MCGRGGGGVFHPVLGRATGTAVVGGGLPTEPWWRPTSNDTCGPSGLPMFRVWPSRMSTDGTRRPLANMPLRLPLSMATHRP